MSCIGIVKPLVSGIIVPPTFIIGTPSNPPFTDLDIFGVGDDGGVWDASEASTLWQLSNGTTPVTAYLQPVGRMDDLTGLGNHITQTTATERRTYEEIMGVPTISLDFIDDSLEWPFGGITGTFWYVGPTGVHVYTLDADMYIPFVRFYRCGFIDRIVSSEEKNQLISFLSNRATAPHDFWLMNDEYWHTWNYYESPDIVLQFEDGQSEYGPPWDNVMFGADIITTAFPKAWMDVTSTNPTNVQEIVIGFNDNQNVVGGFLDPSPYTSLKGYHVYPFCSEGPVPDDIWSRFPTDIEIIDIETWVPRHGFSGHLPPFTGAPFANNLQEFWLYYSRFTGTIDISALTAVTYVRFSDSLFTEFAGTISPTLTALYLQNNSFTQSAVDGILAALVTAGSTNGQIYIYQSRTKFRTFCCWSCK